MRQDEGNPQLIKDERPKLEEAKDEMIKDLFVNSPIMRESTERLYELYGSAMASSYEQTRDTYEKSR